MITCTDPYCHFCHTPKDWSGPIKTTPVKMVTGAEIAEALGVMPPGAFKQALHMSTGEGAGPDPIKVAEQHQEVLDDYNRDLEQANDAGELASETGLVEPEYKTRRVLTEEAKRAYIADLACKTRRWTAAQGLVYLNTGCKKCVEGVDYNDPDFRCLEHRESKEPKAEHRWNGRIYEYNFVDDGIAALELPDPQDSIEGKHQRAARRWGAVKASYRRR